ncbi:MULTISPECIES: carboxypeptidase-like regulatory domain-containing protein [unclassified Variovorax]|uniref:carboxypeptidase-like regulatory domain-containing protein n=1 Tax=unclassified Variovorax TaxID=663243 RepID=UPI003ECE7F07
MRAFAVAVAVVLGACGGGGGGGGGFPIAGLPGATTVTLNGTVTFDSVPNATGTLNYSAIAIKPVRGAVVEVVNGASAVVATASTDASGAYSVSVPSNTTVVVRVKAQMLQTGSGASWDVTVRDNTQSDAIYAMETPAFPTGVVATLTRDVHAPSGWDGTSYASTRVGGPFALLDTIYTTQAKVLSVAPGTAFPLLRVFWSVNNVPASGNLALGQIGTTFFTNRSTGRAIYVLGKENVDTDEYDAPVVAHEWGHYYQSAFSRDDSPGGSHSLSGLLDRRLAFSEGWGNAWSGIALGRSNYTDSTDAGQAQGGNLDLRAGASSPAGWYREASIHSILWNLNNQVGFKPIHDTLTAASFKSGVAVTSIHPFAVAFNATAPGGASALNALLTGQGITVPNDPFGTNETNHGGLTTFALPMYTTATVGVPLQACVTNQADPVPRAGNKLGSYAYLRFTTPAARNYAISATGPAGSDPDFVVYQGRQVVDARAETTVVQAASVPLAAGESVLVLNDFNNSSSNTCFNVTIN